jgi:hypothetical protein
VPVIAAEITIGPTDGCAYLLGRGELPGLRTQGSSAHDPLKLLKQGAESGGVETKGSKYGHPKERDGKRNKSVWSVHWPPGKRQMVRQKQGKGEAQDVRERQPSKESGPSLDDGRTAVVGLEPYASIDPLNDYMVA